MGTRSVLAPALLALTAPPALAADQLVKGTRLILKASIARERLSFRSRGPFILPTPGSGDDPTNVGATFQIINPNTSESFTFDLPSTHWSVLGSTWQVRMETRCRSRCSFEAPGFVTCSSISAVT